MTNADFDPLADDYAKYRTGYSNDLVQQIVGFGAQPGRAILDVACGTGIATALFAERRCMMTGVDPSEEMLMRARERLPNATFVAGRAEALPFESNAFDGAICAQAFHWFDQPKALAELIRVVKPGGPVAIWWKQLAADIAMRDIRAEAERTSGVEPLPDLMAGGFQAFYAAPFADRALRVIPFTARIRVADWMGYEHSRKRITNALDETALKRYFDSLQMLLIDKYGSESAIMDIRYVQYVYTGFVSL